MTGLEECSTLVPTSLPVLGLSALVGVGSTGGGAFFLSLSPPAARAIMAAEGGVIVDKEQISKIVDDAFVQALSEAEKQLSTELYPAAFANEYSWMHVKNAIAINNKAIRTAVKQALASIFE